jgi:hypothetical protein
VEALDDTDGFFSHHGEGEVVPVLNETSCHEDVSPAPNHQGLTEVFIFILINIYQK